LSKEKLPYFPFYPRDLLSDINWRMMNYPERGMYWELVSVCWLEGRLPADLGALARLLQITPDQLESAWRMIGKCFVSDPDDTDLILHPRLELERAKYHEWSIKSAKGGRASAHKRKQKKNLILEQGGCEMAPTKRQPNLNLSSSYSYSNANTKEPPIVPQRGNGVDTLFIKFWEIYPRHENKAKAYQSFCRVHPDEPLLEVMTVWLKEACQSEQWQDKKLIPFATTWLNQRRWEGDPPPRPFVKHEETLTEQFERLSRERHAHDNH
jgi:uncharacterized protein YdaU (DUF1376 family)